MHFAMPSCSPTRSPKASDRHSTLPQALAGYAQKRDETTLPMYRENMPVARFAPMRRDIAAPFAVLQDDPDDTRRSFMGREDLGPSESFFNPANLPAVVAGPASARASGPDRPSHRSRSRCRRAES